jgi:hypothetical protein
MPLFFLAAYFILFFRMVSKITTSGNPENDMMAFHQQMLPMFVVIGIFGLLSIGLMVLYLVLIINNPKFMLPAYSSSKVVWILVILLAGTLGKIIYFFVEIWPEKQESPSDGQLV